MNNIDLNTITVAEAKAAGVTGMDMLTVLRNPVNSEVTKKNEEFAADLNAKTAKKKPVRKTAKRKIGGRSKAANLLPWSKIEKGFKTTFRARFFEGLKNLLGNNFKTWSDSPDYNDALLLAAKDIFGEKFGKELTDEEFISRSHLNTLNLKWAVIYSTEGTNDSLLGGELSRAYGDQIKAANTAGLISNVDASIMTDYIDNLKK